MKILVVAHESEFNGGANRSLYTIINGLKKEHEIVVLLPCKNGGFIESLKKDGIKVVTTKYYKVFSESRPDGKNIPRHIRLYGKYVFNIAAAKAAAKYLKHEDFDVIYSNTRMTSMGWQIAHVLKIPHVMHIREFGHEHTIWGPCSIQRIYKESETLICITGALKNFLSQFVPEDKLLVSYNGIPEVAIQQHSLYGKKTIDILLTGRITEAKGQETAVLALNELLKHDRKNIRLHFAGSYSNTSQYELAYYNNLKRIVGENHLEDYVHFYGEVKNMPELRREMDVELLCAECETFGRVTVEGMRSGLLFIGTNSGGTPEIVSHEKTGLLFEPGNIKELASRIAWIFDNVDFAEEIRKNGCVWAQQHYKIEQNVSEVEQILCDAVKRSRTK